MRRATGARWRGVLRGLLALLVALTAVTGAAGLAEAHTGLESSTPAQGATVTSLPAPVRLRFEDPVVPGTAAGVLTGPEGRVDLAAPAVRGTVVTMTLPRMHHAGHVTLAWRVVAEDGHPVSGTLDLTVTVSAVRVPTPTVTTPSVTKPAASSAPSPATTGGQEETEAASVALAATEAVPAPPASAAGGPGVAWGAFALLLVLAGVTPRVLARRRTPSQPEPGR